MGRSPRLTSKDMTRQELPIPSTSLRNFIAEGRQNRPSDKIKVTKLTIHNTDNTATGANAKAHSSFVIAVPGLRLLRMPRFLSVSRSD
jgi:hypothetical protein